MQALLRVIPDVKRDSIAIRQRALERLYLRKAAVDELIESLEKYARTQRALAPAPCIPLNAVRK